jgi:hypothetical protein
MITQTAPAIKSLYEKDHHLWLDLEEVFAECYLEARKAFAKALTRKSGDFPDSIATLEQVLDDESLISSGNLGQLGI